jgi:glucan endo-1,3-alpha-glucosidase
MTGASATKDVQLDIRGKNELRLVVTDASDNLNFDHADWAEAKVDSSSPPPPPAACNDGQDNDGDGKVDLADPGCSSSTDNDETDPTQPPANDKPDVCAHWHVAAQRAVGNPSVAEYLGEFQKAADMGIECFALNVNGWDSSYQANTSIVWDTATLWNAAHPNQKIYLYPSIDMSSITSEATFETISRYKYNDPARLRVDGGVHGNNLPVTQTWLGNNVFNASSWDRILDEEAAAGFPVFFMPNFNPANSGGSYATMVDTFNGANNSDPSDDIVDGFYNFGGLEGGADPESSYRDNAAFVQTVQASPGMDAQIGCAPNFNRHSDTGQFGNRIIGNFAGFHAFAKCMEGYATTQHPRFMEFTTWNDYLEGSYLGGPYTNAQLSGDFRGNNFSHDAFRAVGRYYIDWYETGSRPAITRDFIAIAHRPTPKCVAGITANGSPTSSPCFATADDTDQAITWQGNPNPMQRQFDFNFDEDKVYAYVRLTQPGDVVLHSGSTQQTFSLPAGISEVSMPFANGAQSVELVRGGSRVLSAQTATSISSSPTTLFNYNVDTAFAQGT